MYLLGRLSTNTLKDVSSTSVVVKISEEVILCVLEPKFLFFFLYCVLTLHLYIAQLSLRYSLN